MIPVYLIPVFAELDCSVMESRSAKFLASIASIIPDFSGMVYAMRDRRKPDDVKIGHCKRNAFCRMAKSPYRNELGNIPHEYRQEELILICRGVSARKIEKSLHKQLKSRRVKNGFGREWFKVTTAEILQAIDRSTYNEQEMLWLEEFSQSMDQPFDAQRMLNSSVDANLKPFANFGDIHCIIVTSDRLVAFTKAWCPVGCDIYDNGLPMPFFRCPGERYVSQQSPLDRELAALGVEPDEAIPDVSENRGQLLQYRDDLRIDSYRSVGHVVNDLNPRIDYARGEWLVGDEIFEIAFSVRIGVAETFRRTASGSLVSEGLSRYW